MVIVTRCELLAPTTTLPKASLEGLNASSPVPAPESETVWVPFEASLLIDSVALNIAVAFGVNETLRVVLCPAANPIGSVGNVSAKCLLETDAALILTVLLPELVAVIVRLFVVLGLMLPKSRLALPRTRFPTV